MFRDVRLWGLPMPLLDIDWYNKESSLVEDGHAEGLPLNAVPAVPACVWGGGGFGSRGSVMVFGVRGLCRRGCVCYSRVP